MTMTAHDERAESSEPSEAMESDTRTPSEQSVQKRPSGEEESAGANVEGTGGSSSDDRSSEDGGGGGQGRERETGASQSPPPGATGAKGGFSPGEERAPLFSGEEADQFRERWANVQAGFVDQPRQMVEQADDLVSDLMQQLTSGFSERRSRLEQQWSEGEDVSTEELRVALTRYRSFFNRLLSA
jgi:hypothetical protein